MSGAGDNRGWRRSGQVNRPNQDARSGNNTPTRENSGRQQPMSAMTGNVWGGGRGKAAGDNGNSNINASRGVAQPSPSQPEQHVPVSEFNAAEVKEYMKKRYHEIVGDQPSIHYKVQGDSVAKRSSGAWGSRGNMSHLMPNGQDFFTQLKKQLAALDQDKTT